MGGYNNDPIKWRVLQNADGKLFLLADQNLEKVQYNMHNAYVTWETSTVRSWLNGYGSEANQAEIDYSADNFLDTAFTDMEQAAIPAVTVSNGDNPEYRTKGGNDTTDQLFLLSFGEAKNTDYGFAAGDGATDSRIAMNTVYAVDRDLYTDPNGAGDWWLRSPGYFGDYAAMITTDGAVYYNGCSVDTYDGGARPAFHLDLNAVLFTSAAPGGKVSGDPGADALTAISDYAGPDWKLTMLDGSRNFAVTETAASAAPGGSVTLNYTGATVGTNEYVSAILLNSYGESVYYGRLAQPASENGTLTIDLPSGLVIGSYTLKLFSEQYNGDYKTDYASAFQDVALTVESPGPAIQLVTGSTAANIVGAQASSVFFGTYKQSSDGAGGYNIEPIQWRVLQNADGKLFLLADQALDGAWYQAHEPYDSVTWESSTMRSWLNGYPNSAHDGSSGTNSSADPADSFIGTAFTAMEQAAIPAVTVINSDNPIYGTSGGSDTTDHLFLLSIDEAKTTAYGFMDIDNPAGSRAAMNTAYTVDRTMVTGPSGAGYWWLRSPGNSESSAALVDDNGCVAIDGIDVTCDVSPPRFLS